MTGVCRFVPNKTTPFLREDAESRLEMWRRSRRYWGGWVGLVRLCREYRALALFDPPCPPKGGEILRLSRRMTNLRGVGLPSPVIPLISGNPEVVGWGWRFGKLSGRGGFG